MTSTAACPKTLVIGQGQASSGETGTHTAAVKAVPSKETGIATAGRNQARANAKARKAPSANAPPKGTS
jgi:hypothetical protein